MESNDSAPSLAVFCDFENVALGVKDAKYDAFDIHLVLERLLDKGKIVVKKAYADWERYRSSKRGLHEAAFEMIEIPHTSYSGKNSADIRICVDALDLCYTKDHVDVFVIISGDSDFSPLVSKLRENAKNVIGIGVKNSSSTLLIENCDDFIFYDDLVREQRSARKQAKKKAKPAAAPAPEPEKTPDKKPAKVAKADKPDKAGKADKTDKAGKAEKPDPAGPAESQPAPARDGDEAKTERRPEKPEDDGGEVSGNEEEAMELVLETVEALFRERDENLWGSMVKQTLKRKKPHFSETSFGYRTFNQLLEDAEKRGLLEIEKDQKSGGYLIVAFGPKA
jgi:uncharacterized protein (TIGR00288 family)